MKKDILNFIGQNTPDTFSSTFHSQGWFHLCSKPQDFLDNYASNKYGGLEYVSPPGKGFNIEIQRHIKCWVGHRKTKRYVLFLVSSFSPLFWFNFKIAFSKTISFNLHVD